MAVLALCLAVGTLLGNYISPPGGAPSCHAAKTQQDNPYDCERVKDSCSRKSGCKCELKCDKEGRRQPQQYSECPAACCESKCHCHPFGCP